VVGGVSYTLYQGDCIQEMKQISNCSIDLTVTSPPYDNLRTYNGNNVQWGEHVWKGCIEELYRVTKTGGVVVWVVGDATIKGSETGTSFRQALFAKDVGFNLHDTMIWNKGGFTAVGTLQVRYGSVFEYMFIFSKSIMKTFNPIKDRICKQGGTKLSETIRCKNGTMKSKSNKGKIQGMTGQRFNVWKIYSPNNPTPIHPATFPEKLARDHIISWSNKGDIVFDPFMGSGTTGKMAKQLGRDFIGIELDPTYFEIAKRRITNHQVQSEMFE